MEIVFIGIAILSLIVIGIALTALFFRFPSKKAVSGDVQAQLLLELQREMAGFQNSMLGHFGKLSDQFHDHVQHNTQFLSETQKDYHQTVSQVQHRLGELNIATQSMVDIGKDIASLQDILRAPKLRGGIGELLLAELLRQILPEDHFSLQFAFRSGAKVDAVIRVGEGLIPVDAKFPLENFQRLLTAQSEKETDQARKSFVQDVKKHIDDIAARYILPDEGTYEFAMMYIPAENVYYETIIKDDKQSESISTYALQKKVIPVSPNSFYAYLQAVARGLKGMRIEQSAQKILERLGQLETEFTKFMVDFEKLGSHLSNAQSSYEKSFKKFERLQTRLGALELQENKPLVEEAESK
ncbi:MAG: hypothetical protein A2Z83_02655 [Omnitrophica bacterium GWA2_52_8]|nr:MAG: hypothetical protein A2Z83_02655 [Omnitrophica bacterium GWA2_52_8]